MIMINTYKRARSSLIVAIAMVLALGGVFGVAAIVLDSSPAQAVIGRPFTPLSYGGMARRTSRRTARRTAYRYSGGAYPTALPAAGCGYVGGVYNCGAAAYRPYYDGPNVVYVEVDD